MINLDQGETGMLFVVCAETAIQRAAIISFGLHGEGAVAGFEIILGAAKIFRVRANQRLLYAVLAASFLIIDIIAVDQNFGRNGGEASLAERGGLAIKQIIG